MIKDIIQRPTSKIVKNIIQYNPRNFTGLTAWYKYKRGITITGSGVSQWNDASGNGNHLLQGTDAARPQLQSDGTILFDGIAQFLKTSAFTLNQPETIYLLLKQVSWTLSDYIFDGNATGLGRLLQSATTPGLILNAGASLTQNDGLVVGTYGVISAVLNGASSVLQIDKNTPTTGNAGANNMGGFTLGRAGGATGWSNIQVREVIIYNTAHDSATRNKIIDYLNSINY